MQHPGVPDYYSSSYYRHFDHLHSQNPNPISIENYISPPPQPPYPATSASAPPLSSSFATPPDYPNCPQVLFDRRNPTALSLPNPNPQFPYEHPNTSYYPYDHIPNSSISYSGLGPEYTLGPYYGEHMNPYDLNSGNVYDQKNDSQGYGDDGMYRYEGGKAEPYGARGTAGFSRSSEVLFDDYGRPISVGGGSGSGNGNSMGQKVVRAVPKEETEEDVKGGAQKFRVKVLSEGYGQSDLDVVCQIGLDGIHMLDPATSRTLRIYPFEAITKWEVLDSYIFAFWAKMPVDIESKRIRLKSNSDTTITILDTVTAASVQVKEIAERKVANSSKTSQQLAEKKKGFDWMNLVKPPNEEKEHWVLDEAVSTCSSCGTNFNAFVRRHHCRNCGEIFCDKCTQGRTPLTSDEQAPSVRVCDRCMAEVTQRLENAKEAGCKSGALLSHEDLAKRLKEEMNRNSKASSVSKYDEGSRTQKREVACPTCTVHLQVEVPSSGSETIECSVCQHPFLVNAH